MKHSIKFLYKKFFYIIAIFISLFLFIDNVDAAVSIGGSTLNSSNFVVKSPGNQIVKFSDDIVYGQYGTGDYPPPYYLVTFCTDSQDITSWYDNDGFLPIINFYNTNFKCMFPNSTYTGGHIVYLYGQITPKWSTSATTATLEGNLTYYQPNQASWALLSIQTSNQEISIDYANGSIISQNATIIDQNSQMIAGQNSIYNKIQSESNETQQKLDETNDNLDKIDGSVNDLNDSINNSDVDNPSSKIEEFENMLPENGVITQLITLPISLFQRVLISINGTCQVYSLGNLFGTDLTLPCINISNYLGTTLWNVIDVLFSGLFVLVIGKKMIKVFNNFTSMEEGDVLD